MTGSDFDPYEKPIHPPKSTSPRNVPPSSAWMSRKDVKADRPKNIGFRGRHNHGKAHDDPVYPTRPIPPSLKPKPLMDWRSGGRIMLVAAMAMLERRMRLRTKPAINDFTNHGFCSPRCGYSCAIERRRIFCGWFVPDTVHSHVNQMDGIIRKFKGLVKLPANKPLFTVMNQVAQKHPTPAVYLPVPPETVSDEDSDDEIPADPHSQAEASMYLTTHTL